MGMVFKGIVERIFGIGVFTKENNSKLWKEDNAKQLQQHGVTEGGGNNRLVDKSNLRLFDIERSNVRLSFMFNGAPTIIGNHIGAIIDDFTTNIDWEAYRNQLRKTIHSSIEQCRSITLFFNSGLHDISFSGKNSTDHRNLYGKNLKLAINYLQVLVDEEKLKVKTSSTLSSATQRKIKHHHRHNNNVCVDSNTTLFWVNIVPTFGERICTGGYVRQYNEIASKVMKRFGIRVLDVYSMLTGFPQDSDGIHCLKNYIYPSTPYKSYSCNRLVDSYLHAILSKDI